MPAISSLYIKRKAAEALELNNDTTQDEDNKKTLMTKVLFKVVLCAASPGFIDIYIRNNMLNQAIK